MSKLKFDTTRMHEALDGNVPEITPTPLGRHRLMMALFKKYGASWRNIPKAKEAMKDFDNQHEDHRFLRQIEAQHPSRRGVK